MARGIAAKELPFQTPQRTSGGSIRSLYDAAASQQAQDYDDIMAGYDSLQSRAKAGTSAPVQFNPLSSIASSYLPNYSYNRSADMGKLVGDLQSFSDTGGYSDSDISSLRERGLSPDNLPF